MQILDHGYLEYVEHWGSDNRIVESARMSTGKGFLGWGTPDSPGDERLLRFLHINKHTTPFEMAGLTLEVQAPIMVFREWHRHRTQSYSEMSARYAPLPNDNYLPTPERCLKGLQAGSNKQAQAVIGSETLTLDSALAWLSSLASVYDRCEQVYQDGLKRGIPKELARLCVPVGRYSRMRASANLLNWLRFLTLRMAPDAQEEIRLYANAVGDLIAQHFPRTWMLFMEKK